MSDKTTRTKEIDWKKTDDHLKDIEDAYRALVGVRGANPFFALGCISAARRRFDSGERTDDLHAEIMGLE